MLSVLLVVALIASLQELVDPQAAHAAPAAAPAQVPAADAGPDEAVDIPSALATARLRGRRVEALSERTEASSTWANPEGTRTTEMNAGPIRVRRGDAWLPVDLTLVKGNDGLVRPKAHPRDLVLAGGGGVAGRERDLASVTAGRGQVAMAWSGPLPEPVLAGDTATYPGIRPGVDLQVKATLRMTP